MKKPFFTLAILLAVVAVFVMLTEFAPKPTMNTPVSTDPYTTSLSGVQVCLPHKNTEGPQTLECAFGMKTDAGDYYALDFNMLPGEQERIQNGVHFTATGVVTPVENLSSNNWQKYNIKGIFSVTSL